MERKTWIIIGAGVLAFGGVLSLFQDSDDSTADAKPRETRSAAVTPHKSTAEPSTPTTGSGVPTPDAQQRAALIRALTAVDAGLVTKEDRAVSRARSTCLDIKQGKEASAVQSNTKQRFEGGTVPTITDAQATAIVAAVKTSFCS
ncbi:DUF732 domain-containing protein [Streptomyces qinzhouensis]|uniref:DUF732 domain-containing protein n=1 Tax=Streptomyces qinzhouensis TaxID=2599401 RepID=A0A5B8IMJ6_9ACTN|nr:DUF732 domain-containing protein [Streptomyces qinzhouensis]QDY79822.1 hypothetical protein FQU76_28480 [Streptomyces qinzhouensis]